MHIHHDDEFGRYLRLRWMRGDAERYLRPDRDRFFSPAFRERKSDSPPPQGSPQDARRAWFAELACRRLRCELASLRVELALLRLALKAYNPNQPRVPAGNPDGGQWTSEEGVGTRTQLAQNETERPYSVTLAEEEARGGHTIRDHVGKSDQELMAWVHYDRGSAGIYGYIRYRQGSFESIESANDFVNRTIERHKERVDQVASGKLEEAFLNLRFGYRTGREAFRPAPYAEPYLRDTYEVGVYILHDPRSPRGYRVYTAYPRNSQRR